MKALSLRRPSGQIPTGPLTSSSYRAPKKTLNVIPRISASATFTSSVQHQRLDFPSLQSHSTSRRQVAVKAQAAELSGDLGKDAYTLRRFGWISFWSQLALSIVSAIVLFFTVTSSRKGGPPTIPVFFTLAAVAFSFISTFFAYGYTRVARKVIIAGETVKRSNVVSTILSATRLNLIGIGSALVGLQALVGQLVGKTLSSSTSNPYAAGNASAAGSTPTAIDVFTVQASTNTLLAHFVSILFANWLLRLLNRGAPPAQGTPQP